MLLRGTDHDRTIVRDAEPVIWPFMRDLTRRFGGNAVSNVTGTLPHSLFTDLPNLELLAVRRHWNVSFPAEPLRLPYLKALSVYRQSFPVGVRLASCDALEGLCVWHACDCALSVEPANCMESRSVSAWSMSPTAGC